jgi:hypothetical protein
VSSREPPSTTTCSISPYVWRSTLASVRSMKRSASSAGVMMLTTMLA